MLTVIDKYTKQIRLITRKTTFSALDWAKHLLVFWMTADWGILIVIIFN